MTAAVILRYVVTGTYGGSRSYEADLCQYHANVRKTFSREVKKLAEEPAADAKCDDCRPVKGPTILDRIIETEDAAAKTDEPAVRVLPGQRRLF